MESDGWEGRRKARGEQGIGKGGNGFMKRHSGMDAMPDGRIWAARDGNEVDDTSEGPKVIWSLILPHFTEKGVDSFKAFYAGFA